MADLAKLANLSKRLKSSTPKVNEESSNLGTPISASGDDDAPIGAPPAPKPAPVTSSAPPATSGGGGGGGPAKVTVNMDLQPVTDMLGRIRDEMKNLREEVKKTREKGMKVALSDDATEQMDQILKHLSSVSKAGRELTEKLVTSLPESRWYGDLLKLGQEVGEGMVAGGGGGGGGNPEDVAAIKEQLEMQKTQLTAILSILQRR